MDPSRAPRSLPLRLAGGRGAGGESEGGAGAVEIVEWRNKKTLKFDSKVVCTGTLDLPFVFDFELLLLALETGETLLLCPLVAELAGEGVWFD